MTELEQVIQELKSVTERLEKKLEAPGIERRYMTFRQAGTYCGKSPEAMRMMARRGRIHVIKQGKSIWIDKLDIDQAMAEQKLEIPE